MSFRKQRRGMIFTNRAQPNSIMKRVFIVNEKFTVLQSLYRWFLFKGCEVNAFSSSQHLFQALKNTLPDIIVIDADLACEDGSQLYTHLKNKFIGQVLIVLFSAQLNQSKYTKTEDALADLLPQGCVVY